MNMQDLTPVSSWQIPQRREIAKILIDVQRERGKGDGDVEEGEREENILVDVQ